MICVCTFNQQYFLNTDKQIRNNWKINNLSLKDSKMDISSKGDAISGPLWSVNSIGNAHRIWVICIGSQEVLFMIICISYTVLSASEVAFSILVVDGPSLELTFEWVSLKILAYMKLERAKKFEMDHSSWKVFNEVQGLFQSRSIKSKRTNGPYDGMSLFIKILSLKSSSVAISDSLSLHVVRNKIKFCHLIPIFWASEWPFLVVSSPYLWYELYLVLKWY